jgi:spore photoproduct lyase
MTGSWPSRIIIWPDAVGCQGLPAVLQRAGTRDVAWVDEGTGRRLSNGGDGDGAREGLHLRRLKGRFLVPCPGTRGYLCCGYQVLRVGENCNMACAYCVLSSYFEGRTVVAHVNWGSMWEELSERLLESGFRRIGTGEFTDSLSWDALAGLAPRLVRFFSLRDNALLELKTKSGYVDALREAEHGRGTMVSWSVNPPEIVRMVETGTATLEERIKAACRVVEWGYGIGLHFDPLIWYPGWQGAYRSVVTALFRAISPSRIVWISLGALRFPSSMAGRSSSAALRRLTAHGEWVRGCDGKQRYYMPMRVEMYSTVASAIREVAGNDVTVYLCMESPDVWRQSLGWAPGGSHEVADLLDRAALQWRRGNGG